MEKVTTKKYLYKVRTEEKTGGENSEVFELIRILYWK